MSMTEYRAMCAELVDDLEMSDWPSKLKEAFRADIDRARALLAQPEPEGLPHWSEGICGDGAAILRDGVMTPIEEVIAELNRRPTPQPVAVSERLPEAGEWVWHCYVGVRFWQHGRCNRRQFFIGDGPESQPATHWLPANALPTPEATND